MKPQETRDRYIELRAEGKSYRTIAKELGISVDTCKSWEAEYKELISQCKDARLEELFIKYKMTTAARIESIGETLDAINAAIARVDLAAMPPDKLLALKLKYNDALKAEYNGIDELRAENLAARTKLTAVRAKTINPTERDIEDLSAIYDIVNGWQQPQTEGEQSFIDALNGKAHEAWADHTDTRKGEQAQ